MYWIISFAVSFIFMLILSGLTDTIVTTLLYHYASTETVPDNSAMRIAFSKVAKSK